MRICMLTSAPFPPREGIGFYVWNLARHLKAEGHTVQILTRGGPGPTRCQVVEDIPIWEATFVPVYPLHVWLHGLFVQALLDRLEPDCDLLHLHSPLVGMPRTRLPALVTVHTALKANVASIPASNWIGRLIKLQAPFSYRIEADLFRRAGRLAVTARSVAQELGAYGIGDGKIAVLANAVDETIFFPGRDSKNEAPYFLTVGRLSPRKGFEDLIACARRVCREHTSVRFLIAGAGPRRRELEGLIGRAGLSGRVLLLGHVQERRELADLYRGAAGYIHPAHYEGLATAMLEAMACGRPVVSTAVSGALDVLRDGENGLLVPVRDVERMAAAALSLLADPGLGRRLGARALETVREGYTWKTVGGNYARLYRELTAS